LIVTGMQESYKNKEMDQQLQSYLGILSHANEYNLSVALKNGYWSRVEVFEKNRKAGFAGSRKPRKTRAKPRAKGHQSPST
jgi:hypothetical protein